MCEMKIKKSPIFSFSLQSHEEDSIIRMRIYKGKKNVFKDDILIKNSDAQRLRRYIKENFVASRK